MQGSRSRKIAVIPEQYAEGRRHDRLCKWYRVHPLQCRTLLDVHERSAEPQYSAVKQAIRVVPQSRYIHNAFVSFLKEETKAFSVLLNFLT